MRKILAIAAFAFFACFYCFGADASAPAADSDATASAPAADAPASAVAQAQASDAVSAASAAAASGSAAPGAVDANADAAAAAGSEKASGALPQAASSALKGESPAAAAVAVDPVKSQQPSPDASHAKQSEAVAANPSSSDRWSFEQMKEYESKKLSISIINSTMQKVQYDKYELQWYSKAYEEAGGSISMQSWEPFRGGEPISKSEFVDIIGDPELLEKKLEVERRVKAKHDSGLIWGGAGLGGVLAGTVMVIVNSTLPAERKSNVLTGIGLGLIGVSLVPVGIGIYNLTYREDIDISADVALSFANDYNIRLESEIRISFK